MPVPVDIVEALFVLIVVVVVGSASLFSAVVVGNIKNVGSALLVPADCYTEPFDFHDISFSCCGWKHNRAYH